MDKVHEMMDDINKQQAKSDEIVNAISNPWAFGPDLYDVDLESELDALQQKNFDNDLLSLTKPTPMLPISSIADLPKSKEKKTRAVADDSEW